jgi:hypothetical protein
VRKGTHHNRLPAFCDELVANRANRPVWEWHIGTLLVAKSL